MKASLRFFPLAELLFDGEDVGERLTGMVQVAECVDDRHSRPARQFVDGLLAEGARDDAVGPAVEVPCDILDGLAFGDQADGKDGIAT